MTRSLNIILFPIDAILLRRIYGLDAVIGSEGRVNDRFVKSAVIGVSELLARHFDLKANEIRLISFDQDHVPATLIPVGELGNHDASMALLLDIDSFACLLLQHDCVDWDRACLYASQDLGMEFWAIGISERGDILRQEYAEGKRLDGYFTDHRVGVNEGMFRDLVQAVVACA